MVVCVFGWWLFWVSRLGGHTPLAALALLSLRERGKATRPLRSTWVSAVAGIQRGRAMECKAKCQV